MRPVQHFRSNFGQVAEAVEVTDSQSATSTDSVQIHENDSHVRNICFVWPNSRRVFFNYAYLVAGEFEPKTDRNIIKLSFSSHSVALHGYGLETLFMDLLEHLPRIITVKEPRYILADDVKTELVVEEILIETKND